MSQHIRIGFLNLLPPTGFERSEQQWSSVIAADPTVTWIPLRLDDDPRLHPQSRYFEKIKDRTIVNDIKEQGLHGLIISGANLEIMRQNGEIAELPFSEVRYIGQLARTVNWARQHVRSTLYSCWASHFALNHFFGLERTIQPEKTLGIYAHDVVGSSRLIEGLQSTVLAPHSRWGSVAIHHAKVDVLASGRVGWLIAEATNDAGGRDVFLQGHPEYGPGQLDDEYERDRSGGQKPPDYSDAGGSAQTQQEVFRVVCRNWLNHIKN